MEAFKNKNGFSKRETELMLNVNRFLQFVQVSENEYYIYCNRFNNSTVDSYKIIERCSDKKRFNVNMNNGIAYRTIL